LDLHSVWFIDEAVARPISVKTRSYTPRPVPDCPAFRGRGIVLATTHAAIRCVETRSLAWLLILDQASVLTGLSQALPVVQRRLTGRCTRKLPLISARARGPWSQEADIRPTVPIAATTPRR
jgi:hypothetical protein